MDTGVACREGTVAELRSWVNDGPRVRSNDQWRVPCRARVPAHRQAVRFYAQTLNYDRAPNRGVYLWL